MNIFVLLCFQAAFFTVSAIDEREAADDRVPPIDIANQEGGDIRAYGQQGIWNVYQDVDGKFIIPYVFDRVTDYNQTHNFQTVSQYESRTFGFPYDYHSIMHYGNTSFATDMTKLTMETLDRKYKGIIGNAYLPTESDYKRICLLYGCQGR
ncbi:hypothetical protein Aduo_003397 [Ancylostoma duodenale]